MTTPTFSLEFKGVTLHAGAFGQAAMRNVSFQLGPGELMLIQVEPGNEQLPLADAAEGLAEPNEGGVAFLGERWSAATPDRQLGLRARIGRVFDGPGWISNLDVLENLTLSQRHHTSRPVPDIIAEAQNLARSFGLTEVPAGRPAVVLRRDLRRAEWIRAFLGQPALILLERPTFGVAVEHVPLLIRAVEEVQTRGAAVILTHDESVIAREVSTQNCLRFRMRGDTMMADKASLAAN
ncbi:MAG: hypothetical protein KKG09_04870 [Verrucomicrobia bacterium]|nr:hypothetical protein [Verrucomicrobiota bacterium]MCG2680249.1 hypothetical protein [Kiritimatiellia bacterium]MBU4248549.1 hypothetical protein [Verrucomicrobiota bacterium]MBU4289786.1 hypothetical protein [Verrucomicrobiota bacterium]MBU4429594.1 hypothetical protein [Verrucomicrobiota bacterium]